jgi:hypothetical protein
VLFWPCLEERFSELTNRKLPACKKVQYDPKIVCLEAKYWIRINPLDPIIHPKKNMWVLLRIESPPQAHVAPASAGDASSVGRHHGYRQLFKLLSWVSPPPSSPLPQVATYSSTVRLPHPRRFHSLAQCHDPLGFTVPLMDPTQVWGSDVVSRWYAMLKILLAKQDIPSQNYTQVFWGFMEFSRIPFVVSSTELPNRTLGFSNAPGLVGLTNLYKIEDIFRRHWGG